MKKLLLFIISCGLFLNVWAQTESEWVTIKTKFEFEVDSLLHVSDKKENEAKFYTNDDTARAAKCIIEEKSGDISKVISFTLDNTSPMKTGYNRYSVGRLGLNYRDWGVRIVLRKTTGEVGYVTFLFEEKANHYRFFGQHLVESYKYRYKVDSSFEDLSKDWVILSYTDPAYRLNFKIELNPDGTCKIVPGEMWPTREIANVDMIKSIDLLVGAASVRISNLKVERRSYVSLGDEKMKNEAYMAAATAYTKAISHGSEDYETYLRRAYAYACVELYNNAIEDCTKSLSYKETQEAYLLRARLKYIKKDSSCMEDFMKGGPEGEAIAREITLELSKQPSTSAGTGSGIIIATNGIIATNYHVIDGAQRIEAYIRRNNDVKKYNAKVLISDKQNDLAILQIDDPAFTKLPTLPYAVKFPVLDVGVEVFALGYPMPDALGEEPKATNGIISSKTGYQGDVVTYQIQTPIQPGNSGGPLFDKNGNLVGVTNAGIPDAQNVGYAIKVSYLRNLVEVSPTSFTLPSVNSISNLSFTEKIKRISPYVVLIKVY